MPITRNTARVLIENEGAPTDFYARFEIQQQAVKLAAEHLRKYEGVEYGENWLDMIRHYALVFVHPFGVHEWIRVFAYDPRDGRLFDPGSDRYVCRNC